MQAYLLKILYIARAHFDIDYTQAPFPKRCPITTHRKRVPVTSKKTHKMNQFLPKTSHYAPFPRPKSTSPERESRSSLGRERKLNMPPQHPYPSRGMRGRAISGDGCAATGIGICTPPNLVMPP
ncbi:hypothetical protein CDAR_101781 [Caerostris darwini]|uniref:Uncharacterized protein n=1 Tax=Caerostris darwini TaxID=1538125 RepID=A0AAV4SAF5_9ARAC|nr:hypothetical protein CDAR_101781 [Caerostris darwini]